MRSFISPNSRAQRQMSLSPSLLRPASQSCALRTTGQGSMGWAMAPALHAPQEAQIQPAHSSNSLSRENSCIWGFNEAEREESHQPILPLTCSRKYCIFISNRDDILLLWMQWHWQPMATLHPWASDWVWGKFTMSMEGRRWDLAHNLQHHLKNITPYYFRDTGLLLDP